MRILSTLLAAGFAASALAAPSDQLASRATKSKASPSSTPSAPSTKLAGFTFFGTSESGAEFGNDKVPGTWGRDYVFPDTAAIQTLMDFGMNTFRIAFLMERLAPGAMTAPLDAAYLANLTAVVDYVTAAGKYAVLDPHNFARYGGRPIASPADFQAFWARVAAAFAANERVIFDCNNEPHDPVTAAQAAALMQACVDGVRGAGAARQYIFVEGTAYSGAWTWTTTSGNAAALGALADAPGAPPGRLVYEMHQYLDADGSGTAAACVSRTVGAERVAAATQWLRAHGKVGVLGEFAGGANADCRAAVEGLLAHLAANSDVWLGALWWGAGPWWDKYIFSMEPPAGTGYVAYKDILSKYVPSTTCQAS